VPHRHCCDDEVPHWGDKDSRTECAAVLGSAAVRGMMMTAHEMKCSAVLWSAAVKGMTR